VLVGVGALRQKGLGWGHSGPGLAAAALAARYLAGPTTCEEGGVSVLRVVVCVFLCICVCACVFVHACVCGKYTCWLYIIFFTCNMIIWPQYWSVLEELLKAARTFIQKQKSHQFGIIPIRKYFTSQ